MRPVAEEDRDTRLRRLHMRSIRRGIKEMDIILTRYSEARLATLGPDQLDLYDRLLWENDQDLYQWVTGQVAAPVDYADLVADIARLSDASR
ncbi:succinate dehydrogenase assembly factor 2 [Roseovarius litoreus]|nr:succinate dehydrogenase assembly factor 2 [Roseovarius litoreus]